MRKKILSVLGILVFAGLIYGVYRNSSVEETDTSISKTGFPRKKIRSLPPAFILIL